MQHRLIVAFALAGAVVAAACSSTEAGNQADTPDGGQNGDAGDAGAEVDADAGSPFGEPTCTPKSGTRIKQKWFVAPGGTRLFSGMYDSELKATCKFSMAGDGKYRCLPDGRAGSLKYSDPECSEPSMENLSTCDVPTYWRASHPDTCGYRYSVYYVGAKEAPGTTHYEKRGADCVASDLSDNDYYALTAIHDSTFVEATLGKISAGRFSVESYEATDGARYCSPYRPFDATLDVATQQGKASDDKQRMLPAVREPDGFSENTCTSPAALVNTDACTGKKRRFTAEESEACDPVITIRSVGAEVATAYESDGMACVEAATPAGGTTWNQLSAPLDPNMFAEVLSRTTGTGRLQYQELATPDGFQWSGGLYDAQSKKLCGVPNSATDKARCLPGDVVASLWFKDSGCTQPVHLVDLRPGCVSATYPDANTLAWLATCEPRVVHVGAAYSGKKYQKIGNSCYEADYPGQVFYEGVDDIDQTTFEELTAVIE
jgi:hypothetical protein